VTLTLLFPPEVLPKRAVLLTNDTSSGVTGLVVPIPTCPAFRYNVFATAPEFTDTKGVTEFWVRVKSAPGLMFVITGLVMVGALENTRFEEVVPVVPPAEVR
jgi:hypothetical protein